MNQHMDVSLETEKSRPKATWMLLVGVGLLIMGLALGLGATVVMTSADGVPVELPTPVPAPEFDGESSYRYLQAVCALGPRPTASQALIRQIEMLEQHFTALGAKVRRQTFESTQPSLAGKKFSVCNLVVHWHEERTDRVLFGVHYDTRPHADQEPIFRRRSQPFLGANDGGSGVALLMELGKVIPTLTLPVGVDFVFFDAEEYIHEQNRDKYFLGSRHFVEEYVKQKPNYRYRAVVVCDMVGDKNLELYPDVRSATHSGALVKEIWSIGRELGYRQFGWPARHDVLDDHVPFLEAGINAVDLIDFDYAHWHRLSDTVDKCSAESLSCVGHVLTEWLRRQK